MTSLLFDSSAFVQVYGDQDLIEIDVFEIPEAEPSELFVNPFACGVNPMDWRELQVSAGLEGVMQLHKNSSTCH